MRVTILIIIFLSGLISCYSQYNRDEIRNPENKEGRFIIEELDRAGFFNITDLVELDRAKLEMIQSYDKLRYFGARFYDNSLLSVDNRFYNIDTEDLFEPGGLIQYLNHVENTFSRLNLIFEYGCEVEYEELQKKNPDYWKHTIKINEKEYVAFEGKIDEKSWGIAFINFANMLNDQLKLQGSKEQVYLIYECNDGQIVFLTDEMYNLVKKYYPNDRDRPRSVEEWKVFYKIN
ncbi:hypothetical protein CLV62_101189 [Dysgonomonas alginatilytica]|uniref:Uncharacterized protein n=1 Tax=Dysgonomonas alginatilytica TaxID=1605892 RepID=A0A2V3PTH6_9BACT|nr:hypothetical protein [Dysgonomonas alginatilytica]PXV68923.1 hypothetical protein CLV62_101189 [Dysgonomonas alginatilytica]